MFATPQHPPRPTVRLSLPYVNVYVAVSVQTTTALCAFSGRYNWMFCIINLRHNSRYVAPPAAGRPSPSSSMHTHLLSNEIFVYSRIHLSATRYYERLLRGVSLKGKIVWTWLNKDRIIAWETVHHDYLCRTKWLFIKAFLRVNCFL